MYLPNYPLIVGIGIDITDIRRIEKTLERFGDRFVERCFTEIERERSERRANRVESYARRKNLPFPVLVDSIGDVSKQFANEKGKVPVPTNVLLDRDHKVVHTSVGFSEERFGVLRQAVERILAD